MFETLKPIYLAVSISLLLLACNPDTTSSTAETSTKTKTVVQPDSGPNVIVPEHWPLQTAGVVREAAIEQRITELMTRMTLEEKVGQIMQADINSVTPQQVKDFNLGSVLNGGNSAPGKNIRNTPASWLAMADEFWIASSDTSDGGVGIPAIWGTDAVHGNSNVIGSTLFPHNIGLGAANDPELMYQVGRVTALEILTTGLDWTFAPTIAVVRNDRWGRTYEGYSEDPRIVAAYAPRIIEGIQGKVGTADFLGEDSIIATAKHFTGDGGTLDGKDQGDNVTTEAELRDIHAVGYPPAIAAGAQVVMASFNSFHGKQLHGFKPMLSDVLVGRMGLDGFVVGDWNGHGQVKGCTNDNCAASFNAGLDMFMVPEDWEALYHNTLAQVQSGDVTMQRLDEAVARILRVKIRAGVLDAPKPSERKHAGNWALLSAPEHKAVARDAVRKSLVLLKNEKGILPLPPKLNVIVAGDGAHNIGKQSGGWTLSWQGTGNSNADFPNGASIYDGIAEVVTAAGGTATLSEDGSWDDGYGTGSKPDVAIVVFGENPYAEGQGDRTHLDYTSDDAINMLETFKKAGVPVVSVFISGRGMFVNPEINLSDAFLAAWLPGSEGGGIADVLFADAEGKPRFDFTGRLSFSWPRTAGQVENNVGDSDYDPLFAYGFGLSYSDDGSLAALPEDPQIPDTIDETVARIIEFGDPTGSWRMNLKDADGDIHISNTRGESPGGLLTVVPADHYIQEDTFIATWNGPATLSIEGEPANFSRQAQGQQVLEIQYQVLVSGSGKVTLAMGSGGVDIGRTLTANAGSDWHALNISLSCFVDRGTDMGAVTKPMVITAEAGLTLQITTVRLEDSSEPVNCDF